MIPYLLGFHPFDSLVLVALEGARKRFGPVLRVDLVDDPDLVVRQAGQVVGAAATNQVSRALLVAFSDDPLSADPLMDLVLAGLAACDVVVEDAIRVDGQRWWSYLCHDPLCCSPDGVPYDVSTARVAAEAVLSGLSFAPDRDALRALFSPAGADARQQVADAVAQLCRREDWVRGPTAGELAARIAGSLDDPAAAAPADLAWLALAVQSTDGQDSAFRLMSTVTAGRQLELWRTVLCRVSDDLVPAVGCLTAFAAWVDGRGVLVSHVLDRVLEVAPDHPVARQLEALLTHAVNPRTWCAPEAPPGDDDLPPPLAG